MDPYEILYGRRCRTPTCWLDLGEKEFASYEIMQLIEDKVKIESLTLDGDYSFSQAGKLRLHFIGPLAVLERVGEQAYRLELPPKLAGILDVFHVCYMRKCFVEKPSVLPLDELRVNESKCLVEKPASILECETKQLHKKGVKLVKILWKNKHGGDMI
ncbi:uncharacterized protein LOC111901357 [Lactuca sativa]|uniref:uncharacterized protein LOC111901357 n=1 Tax=Lactuca sativa TaxID=4236 RepID=UPI000CD8B739|nr:uncharacterized protein LOC111901357 [Lactuca sativa]